MSTGRPGPRLLRALGSRWLSVALMAAIVLGYVVWVVPFQFYGVPAWRVQNIATGFWFKLAGVMLALNTVACISLQVPRIWRRATRFSLPDAPRARERAKVRLASPLDPAAAAAAVARALRRHLLAVRTREDGLVIAAASGRSSALATVALHVAILLLAAVPFAAVDSFRGKATLVEGESFDGAQPVSWSEPTRDEVIARVAELPPVVLTLDFVETEFWRDVQLFTKLRARITTGDGSRATIAINEPVSIGGAQVAIDGFGYAPEFRFVPLDGAEDGGFVKLKVFPPGAVDEFDLIGTVYRVKVSIFPDAEIDGREVVNRTLNLRDPAIAVSVEDVAAEGAVGRVYTGIVRPGEPIALPMGTLSFPSIRHYAEIRVVRNPAAPVFLGALALAMGAVCTRFVARRREVLVVIDAHDEGSVISLGCSAEYWRASFAAAVERSVVRASHAVPVRDASGGADDAS